MTRRTIIPRRSMYPVVNVQYTLINSDAGNDFYLVEDPNDAGGNYCLGFFLRRHPLPGPYRAIPLYASTARTSGFSLADRAAFQTTEKQGYHASGKVQLCQESVISIPRPGHLECTSLAFSSNQVAQGGPRAICRASQSLRTRLGNGTSLNGGFHHVRADGLL